MTCRQRPVMFHNSANPSGKRGPYGKVYIKENPVDAPGSFGGHTDYFYRSLLYPRRSGQNDSG